MGTTQEAGISTRVMATSRLQQGSPLIVRVKGRDGDAPAKLDGFGVSTVNSIDLNPAR